MVPRIPPRFSIDRRTGQVTIHKPFTVEEIKKMQTAVIIKYTERHPEIFADQALKERAKLENSKEVDQGIPSKQEP